MLADEQAQYESIYLFIFLTFFFYLFLQFESGNDNRHYCKPTAVAVMSDSRTFFVSDGYCNQRIIKYVIRSINEKGYHR